MIVITFGGTHDAFAFEDAARAASLGGRLIPLPTGIHAECGLAWLVPEDADSSTFLKLRTPGVMYRRIASGFERLG